MQRAEKQCPACQQPVFIRASTCPHCQHAFAPPDRATALPPPPPAYPARPPVVTPTPPATPPAMMTPPQAYAYVPPPGRKSRSAAILWALFLGGFGAHKFYLGRPGWGIVYLLFCWTWIPALTSLCEIVWLLILGDAEFDRRYNTYYVQALPPEHF